VLQYNQVKKLNKYMKENLMKEYLHLRMDKKLLDQLWRYANKNDNSNLSLTARKALQKFCDENAEKTA
jgi:hypothetical protein